MPGIFLLSLLYFYFSAFFTKYFIYTKIYYFSVKNDVSRFKKIDLSRCFYIFFIAEIYYFFEIDCKVTASWQIEEILYFFKFNFLSKYYSQMG